VPGVRTLNPVCENFWGQGLGRPKERPKRQVVAPKAVGDFPTAEAIAGWPASSENENYDRYCPVAVSRTPPELRAVLPRVSYSTARM